MFTTMFESFFNGQEVKRHLAYLLKELEKSEQVIKDLKNENEELKNKEPVVITKNVPREVNKELEAEIANLKDLNERLRDSYKHLEIISDARSRTIAYKNKTISELEKQKPQFKTNKELEENIKTLKENLDRERTHSISLRDQNKQMVEDSHVFKRNELALQRQVDVCDDRVARLMKKIKELEQSNSELRTQLKEKTVISPEEEKKIKSDAFYKVMNQRIHKDVPNVKRILAHILHPATEPLRSNDDGIGIFFVETNDGKIMRIHESKDRQIYGRLDRIHEHVDVTDALEYCSYLVDVKGYYSNQDLDERFPKGTVPSRAQLDEAQEKFVTWKQRGPAFVETVKEEDIDF